MAKMTYCFTPEDQQSLAITLSQWRSMMATALGHCSSRPYIQERVLAPKPGPGSPYSIPQATLTAVELYISVWAANEEEFCHNDCLREVLNCEVLGKPLSASACYNLRTTIHEPPLQPPHRSVHECRCMRDGQR
jgi:hypothetical protein